MAGNGTSITQGLQKLLDEKELGNLSLFWLKKKLKGGYDGD